MRVPQARFLRGIHRRFDVRAPDDPSRVYTLENARIQQRGETGQVARIQGFETLFDTVNLTNLHDMIMFGDRIVALWHDGTNARIHMFDTSGVVLDTFSFANSNLGYGKLTLLENHIYISPYNRQLNLIDGTWYLNDFKSTTGLLEINNEGMGTKSVGSITIQSDAPPVVGGNQAELEVAFTGSANTDFTLIIAHVNFSDPDIEDIAIVNGDTEVDIVNKIVSRVNGDSALSYEASSLGAGGLRLRSKDPGVRDTHSVSFQKDSQGNFGSTFGVSMDDETPNFADGEEAEEGLIGQLYFSIGFLTPFDNLTYNVQYGDSKLDIANGLVSGFGGTFDNYIVTSLDDSGADPVIHLEAKEIGDTWNRVIVPMNNEADITYSLDHLAGGGTEDGHLELNESYWYTVRLYYHDNHQTVTSFPQFIHMYPHRAARLFIHTPPDLDGSLIDVEIYRKRGNENFFLIDRVTVTSGEDFEYLDRGKPKIRALSQQAYIWNETERTSAIVRDRLVRAGLTYKNRVASIDAAIDTVPAEHNLSIIPDVFMSIYARARFTDGLLSPHELIDELEVEEDGLTWQAELLSKTDDIKEVGFYVGFERQIIRREDSVRFTTLEIYNSHIPSIYTSDEPEGDQDRPANPHVFVGFKQIWRQVAGEGTNGDVTLHVFDQQWNENSDASNNYIFDSFNVGSTNFEDTMPAYFTVEVVTGFPLLYKRVVTKNLQGHSNSGVYEIAWAEGVKDYITTRPFRVNLHTVNPGYKLSTFKSESAYKNEDVDVIGYEDQVDGEGFSFLVSSQTVSPARSNRLYFLLDPQSSFRDFNFPSFNNEDVKTNWDSGHPNYTGDPDLGGRAAFNMLNMQYQRDETPSSQSLSRDGNAYRLWSYDDRVIEQVPDVDLENSVVYLGSLSEVGNKTLISGFEKVESGGFSYWQVPDSVIFETLVVAEDLEQFQQDHPNQLIWSQPFVIGTGISGIRNFLFTNFKTISQDYGPIIDIRYILNHLIVFCERGVSLVNVGETLTQQASGDVFVSSATFLTNDFWLLKHVPGIQEKSIVEYENRLFFYDGQDVWLYSGERTLTPENNITHGAVKFEGDILSAGIDPKHKEYRITDGQQTWAYSMDLGEWMGPYTYRDAQSTLYRDRMFAVNEGALIEHNIGNTFNGDAYVTVAESVALDVDNPSVDKLWRKMTAELDGNIPAEPNGEVLEFAFGKVYDQKIVKNVFNLAKRNGLHHIGIEPSEQNSARIFWRVRSDVENFVLRGLGFDFKIRNRP